MTGRREQPLHFVRGTQEVREDARALRVEARHQVHEQASAPMEAPVITHVVDQPENVELAMRHPRILIESCYGSTRVYRVAPAPEGDSARRNGRKLRSIR